MSDIDLFDFSQFMDEDAGTPSFVKYHQKQLQSCGVRMGRSGYQVHDLHNTPMYHVQIGNKRYSGGVDGGVVPYAVRAASAAKLLGIGFEHKQYTADKATFRMNNPHVLQVRNLAQFVTILSCYEFIVLHILTFVCRLKWPHLGSTHSRKAEVRSFAVCWLHMQCASFH